MNNLQEMTDTPRIIAYYLPQFHSIPENSEWWGEGFTEWTNVKKAEPLFPGHYQPKKPLNNNYYNLLDETTFPWQIDLAKKNNIFGFCFYHYWFDGKLLLEKPAENFLSRKDLDFRFCFSWANEPWTRAWDGGEKEILMPQKYCGLTDIQNHFNYLLPFFKDERYIRWQDKPVFLLYRANSIKYLETMITEWNKMAIENGLLGIAFIETLTVFQIQKVSNNTQGNTYLEPLFANIKGKRKKTFINTVIYRTERRLKIPKLKQIVKPVLLKFLKKPSVFQLSTIGSFLNYSKAWRAILKKEEITKTSFPCAFIDWDNTARKKNNFLIIRHSNPQIFSKYFNMQYKRSIKNYSPFIFINAWNEWGEGAYLEPDIKYKSAYLEAISRTTKK